MNIFRKFTCEFLLSRCRQIHFSRRLIENAINNVFQRHFESKLHNTSYNVPSKYFQSENKYTYNVMKIKGYVPDLESVKEKSSLSNKEFEGFLQMKWTKCKPQFLFEMVRKFGLYSSENGLCITNKIFDDFIENLTNNVKYASDDELRILFHALSQWPECESRESRNFINVWRALDEECLKRMEKFLWSYDKNLSYLSLFYMLHLTKYSKFAEKSLYMLTTRAKFLSKEQLVQTLFYVGLTKRSPRRVVNLEKQLEFFFNDLTVDELAVASTGLFKSKTSIKSMKLVTMIINTVKENSKNIHQLSLGALLKIIRTSLQPSMKDSIYKLLDVLQHEIPRLSVMCNVQIAIISLPPLVFHSGCLRSIADSVNMQMSMARIKDLERLVLTYGTFSYKPEGLNDFFENILTELNKPERKIEIEDYPRSYVCLLAHLGLLEIYPTKLINDVLCVHFLHKTYGKHSCTYGREILTLKNFGEIFCGQDYSKILSKQVIELLATKYINIVPNEDSEKCYTATDKMFLDVLRILKNMRGGNKYVVGDHILAHHQRGDIIIGNNQEGYPITVVDKFIQTDFGMIKKLPDTENIWIVLIIVSRNGIIHNLNKPSGHFLCKVRELEALGYHAAFVLWTTYSTLKTDEDKIDYLQCIIEDAIKGRGKCKVHMRKNI